jgi:Fe-S-cluster containining protein
MTAQVGLDVAGVRAEFTLSVPTAAVPPGTILPVLQILSDAIGTEAVASVERAGKRVSCCAGCGACCRQLVPVSEIEARQIADLVAQLPEPRRALVRARFAEAANRLEQAGLLEILRHQERVPSGEKLALGLAYFRLGVPCPFLDDESCSIYQERPLMCREYMVTSPALNCANPTGETIEMVPLPARLSGTLARFPDPKGDSRGSWVPLVLALEWAAAHPDESPRRPGPEWVALLFEKLSGQPVPPPEEFGLALANRGQ